MNEVTLDQIRKTGGAGNDTLLAVDPQDGSQRIIQPVLTPTRDAIKMSRELSFQEKLLTTDAVAMAAGDVVGSQMNFPGLIYQVGSTVRLQTLTLVDLATTPQRAPLDIIFWDRDPSGAATITNNNPITWGGTHVNVIGRAAIQTTDYTQISNAVSIACIKDVNLDLTSMQETTLYAAFLMGTGGPFTYSAGVTLRARFFFQRD